MYRRPASLDARIDDTMFEKLMDIAATEADSAISFGDFPTHFERAVLAAAVLMLPKQ